MARLASVIALVMCAGCGVSGGDAARHRAAADTCTAMMARLGQPVDQITPERFAEVLDGMRAGERPYSTIEPFLRACRSFG